MKFKIRAEKDNSIKIYLTNLGKYNEGELVGEWVTLPVNDFKPILDKIGINGQEGYEEWFITDYSAPFEINEYDNIEELNNIAKLSKDFSDIDWLAFQEYTENGYNKEEAFQKVKDHDYFYIEGITEREVGENYLDETGGLADLPREELERYFDYEAFGRDLIINGSYNKVNDGKNFGYISL